MRYRNQVKHWSEMQSYVAGTLVPLHSASCVPNLCECDRRDPRALTVLELSSYSLETEPQISLRPVDNMTTTTAAAEAGMN